MRDKELAHLFGLADSTPGTCLVCHGGAQPSMKPFDVREAMQKIDHWTADRAARNQRAARTVPGPVSGRLAAWLRTAP